MVNSVLVSTELPSYWFGYYAITCTHTGVSKQNDVEPHVK